MTNNLNDFGAIGARFAFYALYDNASPSFIAGTDGSLASAEDSGMGRLLGFQNLANTVPQATNEPRLGDNGTIGAFTVNPATVPSGTSAFGSFDQVFVTSVTGRTIKTEGPHDLSLATLNCNEYKPVFVVVNSPATSDAAGSIGELGYQVEEYLLVTVDDNSVADKSTNTQHIYTASFNYSDRDTTPWGETIIDGDYGVTRAWKFDPYWSPNPVTFHTYVGDGGAAQTFTLDLTPAGEDANNLQIWEAGTKLIYTTNYTVVASTGVVTFVGTDPAAAAFAVAKYQFVPGC